MSAISPVVADTRATAAFPKSHAKTSPEPATATP
jgi:hypothetical protein